MLSLSIRGGNQQGDDGDFDGGDQGVNQDENEFASLLSICLPFERRDRFLFLFFLLVYWRIDEGKGTTLENLVRPEFTGEIEVRRGAEPEDIWIALDDGDPMEFEDKWGKKCPTQYSIVLQSEIMNIKCVKKNWFTPTSLTKFTLELWIKPQSANGIILEIGQGIN